MNRFGIAEATPEVGHMGAHTQRGGLQNDGLFGDGGYSTVSGRGG